MDQSRRAVEAYWRTRMIDAVTGDEDKVAPVYKLEEVSELLRTSPASIVKEMSDYILKRLDHKSPVVKQKALRLIKYVVGKSGNEFRREMQRHSAVMRELSHYKGQLDPLKGDALNKAVRATAHEAIAAVFATDDSKSVAPVECLSKRIQGFGNANSEMPTEEKKSFLSEVVGLGSASIMQGLSSITASHSSKNNDAGSYRSPNLRRSLTTENDGSKEYKGNDQHNQSWVSSGVSRNAATGTWSPDSRLSINTAATSDDIASSNNSIKSHEERLLETIVTSGGVRLQPTHDALQAFLAEASKLDALAMNRALELKFQSHLWQVRMKAMCVLESVLRKKDVEPFSIMVSYFTENIDSVVKCTEVPQVSLREKATKVLCILDGEKQTSGAINSGQPLNTKTTVAPVVQMPDLIDTGDFVDTDSQALAEKQGEQDSVTLKQSGSLVDGLFSSDPIADLATSEIRNENDPFADVLFHSSEVEHNDIFSGLTVDDKGSNTTNYAQCNSNQELLDVLGDNSEQLVLKAGKDNRNLTELISGLSLDNTIKEKTQTGIFGVSGGDFTGVNFSSQSSQPSQFPANGALNGNLALNALYPQAPMQYNLRPNIMFNRGFATQPINYNVMGAFIAQQQFLLQNLGNYNAGFMHSARSVVEGSYSSPLPDIFQHSNNPGQSNASVMNISKEETKAFDFISDHLAAARDPRKVL